MVETITIAAAHRAMYGNFVPYRKPLDGDVWSSWTSTPATCRTPHRNPAGANRKQSHGGESRLTGAISHELTGHPPQYDIGPYSYSIGGAGSSKKPAKRPGFDVSSARSGWGAYCETRDLPVCAGPRSPPNRGPVEGRAAITARRHSAQRESRYGPPVTCHESGSPHDRFRFTRPRLDKNLSRGFTAPFICSLGERPLRSSIGRPDSTRFP